MEEFYWGKSLRNLREISLASVMSVDEHEGMWCLAAL